MLWVLIAGVGVAGIWLLVKWIAFSAFKSELMNAFGRKGFDYETADTFYAMHAEQINGLHKVGLSPHEIVNQLFPARSQTNRSTSAHRNETQGSNAITGPEGRLVKIGGIVERVLNVQSVLLRNQNGEVFPHAIDDWLAGYVHGNFDAALQKNGLDLDTAALDEFRKVLIRVFGDTSGREIAERHLACSLMPDDLFLKGVQAGGQDLYNFLGKEKTPPMSWARWVQKSANSEPSS